MNRVEANITTYLDKIQGDVDSLLQKELAVVNEWKEKGILEHLYIKDGRSGAILIFKDIDKTTVEELLATLPLHPHMEKIAYIVMEKAF